jgi:hypothetical protein
VDFDAVKRVVHIRMSKNETNKPAIPLDDSAFGSAFGGLFIVFHSASRGV